MVSPAVAEQQAKLGVSAEESKAGRIKRQQARFRDRGGAFVPSTTNPLVDILLARTVSGESPSKAHLKNNTAKRLSPVKARRTPARRASVVTASDESRAVARNGKQTASRKVKKKIPVTGPGDDATKKQRGNKQAKGKTKVPDTNFGTEQPSSNAKSRSTPKGKSRRRDTGTAPSSSGSNVKQKTRAKSTSAKTTVEIPVSDDDRMLAGARSKTKSNIKRSLQDEDDSEMDIEAPIVRRSALPTMDSMQTSNSKNMVHSVKEKIASKGSSGKKVADTSNGKGKGRANPHQDISEPMEDDERHAERSSKPRKRKKEDSHDDRPRKAVKFSDTSPLHSSSRGLKENRSDKTHETITKSRIKDASAVPRSKLTAKLPSRAKRSKGPPREVLERIKASVGRHMHCPDSDPDELDCLS